jgi:hypothetical protein
LRRASHRVSTPFTGQPLRHLTLYISGERNMMIRLSLAASALALAGFAAPALAAESVGQAASSAANKTGHAVADTSRKVGHGVAEAGRDVGHATAEAGRKTGHAVKRGAQKTKAAVKPSSSPS